jgi:hypothetical protein
LLTGIELRRDTKTLLLGTDRPKEISLSSESLVHAFSCICLSCIFIGKDDISVNPAKLVDTCVLTGVVGDEDDGDEDRFGIIILGE